MQASRDTFGTIGYGPFLRGEDPYEFAKLAPLPEESAAAGASAEVVAAIDSENRRIRRQNAINKIEYDARKKEIENRIASRLMRWEIRSPSLSFSPVDGTRRAIRRATWL